MSKMDELINKYYIAILEYEYYLSLSNKSKINTINIPNENKEIYLQIYKAMDEIQDRDYMPWRLLKGDLKTELTKIFKENRDSIQHYLRICDIVWDEFYSMLEDDLTNHFNTLGKNINDYKVKEEITNIVFDISSTTKLDKKIYSENTLRFQNIVSKFSNIEDEYYKIIKKDEKEQEEELEK